MASCTQCGKESPAGNRRCVDCGAALPSEAARFGKTVMGLPSINRPSQLTPPAPPPGEPPTAGPLFKQTLLGVATPGIAPKQQPASASAEPATLPQNVEAVPANGPGNQLTADAPEPRAAGPTLTANARGSAVAASSAAESSAAGSAAAPSAVAASSASTPVASPSVGAPIHAAQNAHRPPSLPRRSVPRSLWIGAGLVAAAAFGGGIALLQKRPVQLKVELLEVTPAGKDRLLVRCSGCSPKQQLRWEGVTVPFLDGIARLEPRARLGVGSHALSVDVVDAEGALTQKVELAVPIAFRVETDLGGKHANPPFAEVVVTVARGGHVEIQGRSVNAETGKAAWRIALDDARGENAEVVPISKEIPVRVTVDGQPKVTVARIQTAIVPLQLMTPADGHVLGAGGLAVSGRTLAGARVKAGDAETVASASGDFHVFIPTPTPGPLRVEASTAELVARSVVLNLTEAAPQTTPPAAPLALGESNAVTGRVVESRHAQGATATLLELDSGCPAPPCLLRVVYGQRAILKPGQTVSAWGQVVSMSPPTLRAAQVR